MKEIKAREGYYLSDPNKEHFYTAIFGANVDRNNYIEVPKDEAEEIMRRRDAEMQMNNNDSIIN